MKRDDEIPERPVAASLVALPAHDLVAVFLGSHQMIADLNAYPKRLPGGTSSRIHLASLYLMRVREAIESLAESNPSKLADVCDYLALSREVSFRYWADRLRAKLSEDDRAA